MGLLTKTQFETLTDRLYQRLLAAAITPLPNMLAANTEEGLAMYLDEATGDPALQAALLAEAAAVDRQALRANQRAWADAVMNWTAGQDFIKAINTYVKSADGGSYASLAAYVSDVGATVHPLIAEFIRKVLGPEALTLSAATVGAIPPLQQMVAFERVYTGAFGSLVDDTADAGDVDAADVALFAADNDYLVLQSRSQFNRILLDLSTLASADCTLLFYYWNGSAWTALTVTDRTTGMTVNGGEITWTLPADEVPYNTDNAGSPERINTAEEGEYYTILVKPTADTVVTPPVATWIMTCPDQVLTANGGVYGLPQPPLALCRITGANAVSVTSILNPSTRFLYPSADNNALKLRAITSFASDITFTLGYKDQAGAASTQAQSAWSAPIAAGDTMNLSLGADTGLSEITAATCSVVTAATSGMFAIEVGDYRRAIGAK